MRRDPADEAVHRVMRESLMPEISSRALEGLRYLMADQQEEWVGRMDNSEMLKSGLALSPRTDADNYASTRQERQELRR